MLYSGVLVKEFGHTGFLNLSFVLTIDFVAYQNEGEFLRLLGSSLVQELCDPSFDVFEGLSRSWLTLLFVMS